jgi:hypothetical protein
MTTIAPPIDPQFTQPPAYVLQQVSHDFADLRSSEGRELLDASRGSLSSQDAFGWRVSLPDSLEKLFYNSPGPFEELRRLKCGWDGQGAEPLSSELLAVGEEFWSSVARIATSMPVVHPGADNFLVFSWKDRKSNKELSISIYDDEGRVFCDWLLKFSGVREVGTCDYNVQCLKLIIGLYNLL